MSAPNPPQQIAFSVGAQVLNVFAQGAFAGQAAMSLVPPPPSDLPFSPADDLCFIPESDLMFA